MKRTNTLTIQARITCPHCWHEYAPEESLYIAEHPDYADKDDRVRGYARRFLPSRFTPDGDALDPMGTRTSRLACPHCHLEIVRSLYQIPPLFFSILGTSFSGKSYFLAAMSWMLRKTLPQQFGISITDADTLSNARLHKYEQDLFLGAPSEMVALEKTQEDGDFYSQVDFGTTDAPRPIRFPKPFLFNLQPGQSHMKRDEVNRYSRIVCLYDNAGESFLPGYDRSDSPVTRHLALSRCLFFLFDPTQDSRFRELCGNLTDDPQMRPRNSKFARENNVRQDTVLTEAIQRVRRHAGLRDDSIQQRPLIIIVTKWDAWKHLVPDLLSDGEILPPPFSRPGNSTTNFLDGGQIKFVSDRLERLFREVSPEIVAAAEGFAQPLIFLPATALGHSPTCQLGADGKTEAFLVKPADIRPGWVEVPMLYALHLTCPDLVGMC